MGLSLFTVQIYADFSGYSNIARGTAKLFGIDLMENFKQPYLSTSISEFWKTWHISLSTWLKDYIYIPLGGNRKGTKRSYLNLMITMLLGGLWHGANWTFVIYGGLHGLYLSVHKFILKGKKPTYGFTYTSLSGLSKFIMKVIFTNFLVLITRVFFRSQDFDTAFYFLGQMVNWSWGEYPLRILKIIFAFVIVTMGIDLVEYFTKNHAFLLKLKPATRYAIMIVSWVMIILYLYQMKPMPFVYFQF
jgi:D-alanyl-lipoteichoic acid acyltransferase DltB (MBOAT superfamily)